MECWLVIRINQIRRSNLLATKKYAMITIKNTSKSIKNNIKRDKLYFDNMHD